MKKIFIYISAALLVLFSCEKISTFFPRTPGSDIVFGPSSNHGVNTKASYSGSLYSGYERIDWADGDVIRIFCKEASAPASTKYADYKIISDSTRYSGVSSLSKITLDPSCLEGLQWGTGLHKFSALCPAPGQGESGTSVYEDSVKCFLPDVQTYSSISYRKTGSKSPNALINDNYLYLAGHGEANTSGEGVPVALYFDPAVTTFEFTLQNDYASGNAMTIKKAGITTESGKLVGTYKIRVAEIDGEDRALKASDVDTTGIGGSNKITMNFSPTLSIAHGDSLTFTLFAQPHNDITKLTFWLVDSSDKVRSFKFKYSDPSKGTDGWVDFKALHKAKIRGIMTPEGAGWTINLLPVVAPWNNDNHYDEEMDSGISLDTPVVEWIDENMGNIPIL